MVKTGKADYFPYVLIAPAIAVTVAIVLVPIVQTSFMSFMKYVIWKPKDRGFIGFANYDAVLRDPVFWIALKNTAVWIVGVISLQLALGFAAALLLNRDFAWRGIARSLILIPWVTPSIITGLMWRLMYDGNRGVINDILVRLGILHQYQPWLADASTALPAVMVALMWQGFPFFSIMILAGLQSVPSELLEAATVDGAGTFRKFFSVTLPLIVPILLTSILLRIIWVANSLDIIYVMTGGGPGYATYTLPVFSYLKAYKALDFGYAATISLLLTLVLVVFVAGYVKRVLKTEDQY